MNTVTTLCPATERDLEFVYTLLQVSLRPYVEQTSGNWDESWQRKRFDEVTRFEDHKIIEHEERSIGCLCALERPDELRLVRLFLLPAFQRQGIGTAIVKTLLTSATSRGVPVRLRVLRVNPARQFYARLGFVVIGESETHFTMESRQSLSEICEPGKDEHAPVKAKTLGTL